MKPETLALMNARTGLLKFKHALAAHLVLVGLLLSAYFFLFADWFFLLLPAFSLFSLFLAYRGAKRAILR